MSRSGNVWDNAAMESIFSSLKTERIRGKVYRTRHAAKADVFENIERFYTPPAGTRPSAISAWPNLNRRSGELNYASTEPAEGQFRILDPRLASHHSPPMRRR